MFEFNRIKRLPPYVFAIVNNLKMEARHRGEDIIDPTRSAGLLAVIPASTVKVSSGGVSPAHL